MNPPNSVSFSCRAVRAWRSITEAPDGQGFGASHIAGCADCQRFHAAETSFSRALRQDAMRRFENAPAGLDHSILRAVREARVVTPTPKWSGRARLFGGAAVAAAAAAAVAVVAVLQTGPAPRTDHASELVAATGAPRSSPDQGTVSLTELATPVKQAIADNSLQSEVDFVYADARSAVRFLAANFLPNGAAVQQSSSDRRDG